MWMSMYCSTFTLLTLLQCTWTIPSSYYHSFVFVKKLICNILSIPWSLSIEMMHGIFHVCLSILLNFTVILLKLITKSNFVMLFFFVLFATWFYRLLGILCCKNLSSNFCLIITLYPSLTCTLVVSIKQKVLLICIRKKLNWRKKNLKRKWKWTKRVRLLYDLSEYSHTIFV